VPIFYPCSLYMETIRSKIGATMSTHRRLLRTMLRLGRAFRPARFPATEGDGVRTEGDIMSRKTRRSQKRRRKRFNRILSLLEASNLDPKRRNRKTRLRQLWKLVRGDVSVMYRW